MARQSSNITKSEENKPTPTTSSPTASFTVEERERLMNLLRNEIGRTQPHVFTSGIYLNSNSSNGPWIIDSGAIDHISKTFPTPDGNHPKHTFVELPNGGKTRIDLAGTIKLSDDLTIKDVLYVPEFQVNLLFINKFTQALGCNVTFYPDCCLVEDLTTNKVIGKGGQINGLYYLSTIPNVHQTNTSHIPNLWHQ